MGQGTTGVSRSFDITLTKLRDDSQVTFLSIDKEEQKILMDYFKHSGIKTRILDADGAQRDVDFESDEPSAEGDGRPRRRAAGEGGRIDDDMDDEDSEDDGDFTDNGSDNSDDDEEGEEEQEEDASMVDESIDKDELKALQKNEKV